MFKLESYITPVILSYVEKYVKNFKPEQSQVSLWGGDASFQNLDLRLEVLEEQLNLPFTFVSGHIHELLIHVPWVKITSEPIVVTINTIECILNLKNQRPRERNTRTHYRPGLKSAQDEAPPGYIKSIVAKVINNITINCNNLILKYVEEDIVLSVNVRFLSMRSANEHWEAAFADVSNNEVGLRKIVAVEDLTLCLDKMDTSGKIEIYQDPVLYRCSMSIRLMINYNNNIIKYASLTRFDLHCDKMEFSITEQQLPMLLRLVALIMNRRANQSGIRSNKLSHSADERAELIEDDADQVHNASTARPGWSSWVWNAMTSFLPVDWDPDGSQMQEVPSTGHIIHMGVYIDEAVLTFKTIETVQEQLFYKSRKIRYNPFLGLQVTGYVMSMLVKGVHMSHIQLGLGSVHLHPRGSCSCGYPEVANDLEPPLYIQAGTIHNDYLKHSFFDENLVDHTKWKIYYSEYDVNYHLSTVNVSSMLERSPAFGMDIICSIDIPDDFPLEKLSELESNFEYSDFPERKVIRYAMGDLKIKLCSGLMHRINGVKSAAIYDYSIHMANKCETNSDDLPPVTMEEYEALRENIPMIETYFTFHQVQIQFQLTDHSTMRSPYQKNPMENIVSILDPALLDDTYLSVECSGITGSIVQPMYSFRLVSCASQQADISPDMLNKCYAVSNIEVCGMQSTLYLAKQCHTIIVMPCTLKALKKSLVHPQYWQHMGVIHDQMECEIVDITLTGTKSKLMAAASIVMSVIDPEQSYSLLFCSSLLNDARYEKDSVYLEISLDHICWKQIKSLTTISIKIDVDAVKAFALHDTQQAFILSGPEVDIDQQIDNSVLLTAMLQYSEIRSDQVHPAILSFRVSEVRCSFDPLLCRWLQYEVIYNKSTDVHISKPGAETSTAEDIFSDTDVRKKMFRTLHESVHSLSDKDKKRSTSQTEWSKRISVTEDFKTKMATADDMEFEDQSESNNFVKFAQLYPFCRQLILCGSIAHFVIFIPTITMDGIGVDGIQQAKDRALNSDPNLHILVVVTPSLFIHSANVQFEQLCPHLGRLPCKLPVEMWSQEYHSFPWTLRLTNLNCYTLKRNLRMSLIQNVDFTITIDITTKNTMKDLLDSSIGGLGLCIYVDTSPIVLSISDEQITLLNIIGSNIMKVITIPRYSHKKPFLTEQEDMNFYVPKTPSSYTQVMFPENTTTPSSVSTAPDGSEQEPEVPVITAMIQWTITKMSLKVYIMEEATSTCMKFALELEDIITTLDWQPIYLKLKNKIATATISHYIRPLQHQHWKLGDYTGLIMLGRESNLEQIDETGFLSVTFTRAQSGNVHTRWGAQKYPKSHKERAKGTSPLSVGGYITEIDITIQRVDIILPLDVVSKFMLLMKPFVRPDRIDGTSNDDYAMLPMLRRDDFLTKSLPLIYLEFKGMNLMMPISCHIDRLQHDLLMIQLDGISVTPSPENPICRTILRSDIYEFAAQSNILNIPGSSVEDRQYQVNIKGICICTTTWQNYQQNNTKRISKPCLYTMKENPALEWNNLACGSNLEPQPLTCLLISRFDLRLIIAPAVILYSSKIVCGGAVEITCLTEINVSINLDQIKLIWAIYSGISNILSHYSDAAESVYQTDVDSPFSTPVLLSPQVTHNTMVSKEDESDHVADSGINFESSSISYTAARNIPRNENSTVVPLEILVNCGTVTIFLNVMTRTTMEATSGLSKVAGNNDKSSEPPFLQVMLIEPNFYISQLNGTEKMQISCFDLTVSFGVIKQSDSSPIAKSVECKLIESKNGTPHPETGIPPSFIILKWEKSDSTSMRLSVDMDRPTKVNYSLSVFKYIDRIIKQISTCFIYHGDRRDSANSGLYQTKTPPTCAALPNLNKKRQSTKFDLPELSFVTKQLVLSLNTTSETNILISVTKLSGNARTCKTDKVLGNVTLNSFIISEQRDTEINVLLYPTCCDIRVNVFWETWQDSYTDPQVIIQAVCGNAHCAFGPHQMKIVENMIQEYRTFMDYTNMYRPMEVDGNDRSTSKTEQHYKDDLKAGAFQFVVGDVDELPSPYQVTFSVYPEKAMVWKYPQPRIITGLTVTPIPFEITDNIDLEIDTISCSLEYWSDSHREYRRYIEFNLTETENYRPELPTMFPTKAVASIWRVALSVKGNPQPTSIMISPQILAGCLRIDSYFNADIIPNLQLTVSTGAIRVSMVAPLKSSGYNKLPHPLGTFRLSSIIPEMQCVAQLEHTSTSIVFNKWPSGQVLIDVGGKLNVKLLDYGLLHMQSVIEQLESSIQVLVSNETRILIECNPFSVKFGPSIAHTLAVSTNLWLTSTGDQNTCPVILTQIVIANDSNITICFGQSGSTDNVVLHSRECHFYHWRHANNKMLHIAIENSGWSWSEPFCVKKNGKQQVIFRNLSMHLFIYATVISLSATQKLITFSGSLILANRLIECFEMKLVKYQSESNNRHNVADQHHLINGNDHLPSIVLDSSVNTAMRLRFASPSGLSWTGDIPLRTNSKWGQPWLVKVPLQDRGVFQSIWVRIVQEAIHGEMRFLAVLSPLYMIKSYLPVPVVVKIETPSLTMASLATIKGQGELQQLHCPGTFEHSHQLTFQLESGVSASNPYVPLSYNSVDKQTFFRRPQNEDIDTILMELMKPQKKSVWPYETDNWDIQIPAEQPQTHVQIAYQDAGLVSSTLLVELRPWCFILNTLGCQISLTAGNIELCQIPHNGIIAPPKLEGTFYLKVEIGDVQYTSCALQLARPDWNQGFYMPRIKGLIPVEGNIQASLESGSNVCIININSKVHDNMRSVRVAASHVICNFTTYELYVATLAVGKTSSRVDFPEDHLIPSFIVAPSKHRSQGTPIGQWYMVDPRNTAEHEALYISLRRSCSWSCPIRVDQNMTQRCVAISDDIAAIPLVITTHEDDGTIYILIYIHNHPQFYIENLCPFRLILGESNQGSDRNCEEAVHFSWRCEIESNAVCYYTAPSIGNRLPDCQTMEPWPKLLLSAGPLNYNKTRDTGDSHAIWSQPIDISQLINGRVEQYVRLPMFGDVKLLAEKHCHTIHLHVVCLSQAEVSAHEIRTRLIDKYSKYQESKSIQSPRFDGEEQIKTTTVLDSSIAASRSSVREHIDHENVWQSDNRLKAIDTSATVKTLEGSLTIYIRGISVVLMQDFNECGQRIEVASICLSDVIILTVSNPRSLSLCACIGDLQLDNQMFDSGGFDFPVVLMSQRPRIVTRPPFCMKFGLKKNISDIQEESLVAVYCNWDVHVPMYACTKVNIKIGPISAFIEDTFISQLLDYTFSTSPPCLTPSSEDVKSMKIERLPTDVPIPGNIMLEAANLRTPLRVQMFTIEPISLLLSVHTSVRLYVALDHSPLYFGAFEREHLLATFSGLVNALAMHYLSGALFGAGWVVGSLEILGSPGGFAQALGCGLKDFVTLPIQGILRGPWSFIIGITQGSTSLIKHLTAGTVNSVTKLASSVARNLDRLTLDEEHLQRQEESRRMRPQGMAQGLYQGVTGFGISLLAAIAGLAHHPLQQILSGAATPRGLMTGVGLGIVGAVTKPLSGAAELVALTGQGLLEGTGWNPLPTPRQRPIIELLGGLENAYFKYAWELLPFLRNEDDCILYITNVDYTNSDGVVQIMMLIITRHTLVLVNIEKSSVEKKFVLKDLGSTEHTSDPSLLCLYCLRTQNPSERSSSPIDHAVMDQAIRARVERFVRGSSSGCAIFSRNTDLQSEAIEGSQSHVDDLITLNFPSNNRDYFLSLFQIAKGQDQGNDFIVL